MRSLLRILVLNACLSLPLIAAAQDYVFHWEGESNFTNGTANLVNYIDFGDVRMWGYVEITLTGSYNSQLNTGMYGKRYNIGRNVGTALIASSSEVYAALGPVAVQWKLGEFEINAANHLVIPIYNLLSKGNSIYININGVSITGVNTALITTTVPQVLVNSQTRDYQYTKEPIAIGTQKIDLDAKLTVAGKISAREVKVGINAGADFVFDDHYQIPDLQKLKTYLLEHKHLPGIAPAAEMLKSGLAIGDFQIKLLQKIEELTLHLIEKDEQLTKEKERVDKLEESLRLIQEHLKINNQ